MCRYRCNDDPGTIVKLYEALLYILFMEVDLMKWKEFRSFLNTKFDDDDQFISLTTDYDKVVIIKDNKYSGVSNSIILVDNTKNQSFLTGDIISECDYETPSIFINRSTDALEYTENEISTYFGGFNKRK